MESPVRATPVAPPPVTPSPVGLKIMALLQGALAALCLVSGLVLTLLMTGQLTLFSANLVHLAPYFKALVISGLGISGLGAAGAVGLWQCQRWGWWASVGFHSLCLLNNALALAGGQRLSTGVYVATSVSVAFLGGLALPRVRRAVFGPTPLDQSTAADPSV